MIFHSLIVLLAIAAAAGMATLVLSAPRYVMPTRSYNLQRTGAYLEESQLTVASVSSGRFGYLFARQVDGQVYVQPLVVQALDGLPGNATLDVIIVATMANSLYMFEAHSPSASAPIWRVNFGPQRRRFAEGEGVLSTPVIDESRGLIYVCSVSLADNGFRLWAINLRTGGVVSGPVPIQASGFIPSQHIQRTAVTLINGMIFLGFGSLSDTPPWQGWIFAFDAATFAQRGVFNAAPGAIGNAFWHGGLGFSAPSSSSNFLFGVTGNGAFDIANGRYSNAVLKLGLSNSPFQLDYFIPFNTQSLNGADFDLGSSGFVLIPGTSFGVTAGKDGVMYLCDTNTLGRFDPTGNRNLFSLDLKTASGRFQPVFVGPVHWRDGSTGRQYLYVWPGVSTMAKVEVASINSTLRIAQRGNVVIRSSYGGHLTVSSNANGDPNSAIVWSNEQPGIMRAFAANDLSRQLYVSQGDAPGFEWAKFASPTVALGKVFLPTFSNRILVFGLRSDASSSGNTTDVEFEDLLN